MQLFVPTVAEQSSIRRCRLQTGPARREKRLTGANFDPHVAREQWCRCLNESVPVDFLFGTETHFETQFPASVTLTSLRCFQVKAASPSRSALIGRRRRLPAFCPTLGLHFSCHCHLSLVLRGERSLEYLHWGAAWRATRKGETNRNCHWKKLFL